MKKYLLFLMAIMLATVARAADGDTFTFEGLKYTVLSAADHTAEVAKNGGVSGEVNIPTFVTANGSRYIVTSIGEYAFAYRGITSVTIPNSVTEIRTFAFDACKSLTSVTIPNSVTEIGHSAFSRCRKLTSVTIPNSVTRIGTWAFSNCESLPSVTIPNSVTNIGNFAFLECSSLTSVTIPNSVTSYGSGSFMDCAKLEEIIVEDGNKNYCSVNGALYNLDKTQLIQCPGAKTEFDIPNSVTEIYFYAFDGCKSLASVTIPNSVTKIYRSAFAECSSLASVTIPNSVTRIWDYAFSGCSSLTSVTIPRSVTIIDNYAFYNCSRLTKIIDLNPNPQLLGTDAFKNVPSNAVVYIPKGSYMSYMLADGWAQFSDFREMGAFDITLSESTLSLSEGESAELTVTVVKDDEVTIGDHEWTSSNPEVATVEDGKVTAIAPGTAEITYTVYDGYGVAHSESCKVTVADSAVLVKAIILNYSYIDKVEGSEIQLIATVTPDNATNKEIAWSSSNEAVATVSATGLVKILKAGSCKITAATTDGSDLKAECAVSALSGIDDVLNDNPAMADVYTMQGVAVLRNASATEISALPAGLYIIRQGNTVKKIAVK